MKKITIEYEVYEFDELSDEAKGRVISDLLMMITDMPELYPELKEEIKKAQDKVKRMYTPWFFTSYLWDVAEDKLLQILYKYVYLKDGEMFGKGGM